MLEIRGVFNPYLASDHLTTPSRIWKMDSCDAVKSLTQPEDNRHMQTLPESIEELATGIYADATTYETVYINPLEVARESNQPTDRTSLFNMYAVLAADYARQGFNTVLIDEQED